MSERREDLDEMARSWAEHLDDVFEERCWRDEDGELAYGNLPEDALPLTMAEWLGEVLLDWDLRVDPELSYKSARVFVTLGGPTTWLDTEDRCAHVHWGASEGWWGLSERACDALDAELGNLSDANGIAPYYERR